METSITTNVPATSVDATAEMFFNKSSMPGISVPANAEITVENPSANTPSEIKKPYMRIFDLIQDQKVWLKGAHSTANDQLYLLLQRCYGLYKDMCSSEDMKLEIDHALDGFFKIQGNEKLTFTCGLSKIVKCVFGADRRRVSAYCIALRVADNEGVAVDQLPEFFREQGGVEEVRQKKSVEKSEKIDKVAMANQKLSGSLAVINDAQLSLLLKDKTAFGNKVVLIASQAANGSLIVNALDETEAVVKAALTAIYNGNKKDWASA